MNIIEIKLPELAIDDMGSKTCHCCGNTMTPGISSGTYSYNGRKFRIRRMRVWTCLGCGEKILSSEEVSRVECAISEKWNELAKRYPHGGMYEDLSDLFEGKNRGKPIKFRHAYAPPTKEELLAILTRGKEDEYVQT